MGKGLKTGGSRDAYVGTVTQENPDAPLTSTVLGHIIDHCSNPRIMGTPANRINRWLCDPVASQEAAIHAITVALTDQQKRQEKKGDVLTVRLAWSIARRMGLERVFTSLGIPASLQRAGRAFERRKARLTAERDGQRPPRSEWPQIWDDAVMETISRGMERYRNGEVKNPPRWLPLHDGRTTSPHGMGLILSCGGLDAWENALTRLRHSADSHRSCADWDTVASVRGTTDTQTTDLGPAWLAEHGITLADAARLDDRTLEEAGIDPAAWRTMVTRATDAFRDLDQALGDETAAQRLVGRHPDMDAMHILTAEHVDRRTAATMILVGRWRLTEPDVDPRLMIRPELLRQASLEAARLTRIAQAV